MASSPRLPTHPQHPPAIWKLSVILQNALSLHREALAGPCSSSFPFFFHARPPASSPRSLPTHHPRLSFSRIRHRITCYADTSHYYSQGRTGRRTDICKSHVMQYASVRESEIDAHNQSAIDRFALTTRDDSPPSIERQTILNLLFAPFPENAFLIKDIIKDR